MAARREVVLWAVLTCSLFSGCPPAESCTTSGCGDGQVCNTRTGACERPKPCSTSAECNPGVCTGGLCVTCDTALACSGATPVCDPATVECRACTATSCGGAYPTCSSLGCTSCQGNADCPASAPICDQPWCGTCATSADCQANETCLAGACRKYCLVASECPGPADFCAGGRCLECRTTEDCAEPLLCYLGTCRPPLPGDACRNALPLTLVEGRAEVRGMIGRQYLADSPIPQSVTVLRDVFYRVEVSAEGGLNAELTMLDELLSLPGDSVAIFGGACGRLVLLASDARSVHDVFVVPGTYWVRVAHDNIGPLGAFRLRVFTSAVARATGNHCFKPQELDLSTGLAHVDGDTTGLQPVDPDWCDQSVGPGPDQVYAFSLTEPTFVSVAATPASAQGRFDLALVADDCWAAAVTQCTFTPVPGPTSVALRLLPAGRYFLHVRTRGPAGAYSLDVTATPRALNGTCETAEALVFDAGVAWARGDLRFTEEGPPLCPGIDSARGLHYLLSTRGLGARSLKLAMNAARPAPDVQLGVACADAGPVACGYNYTPLDGGPSLELPLLAEGDYDFIVSTSGAGGPFELQARLGPPYPPPANDNCVTGPTVITPVGGAFSLSGDTRGADDSARINCGDGYPELGELGRDVVYHLPFTSRARVDATLSPEPGFDAFLGIVPRVFGCNPNSVSDCVSDAGPGGLERLSARFETFNDAGIMLWVDGRPGSAGTFTLTGTLTLPPPEDTCTGARTFASGQVVNGSLAAAFKDQVFCGSVAGPDLFYQFTAGSNGTESVTVTPTGFDATLVLLANCSGSCVSSVNVGGGDQPETLTFPVSRNVSYTVGVLSPIDSEGTFTLTRTGP